MHHWLILFGLLLSPLLQGKPVQAPHIEVDLVSEYNGAMAGQTLWVGIRMEPEYGWHVYWQNPGDSGEPPKVKWELDDSIQVGPIHWPAPERIQVGPLANFGYSGPTLLPVPLTLPQDLSGKALLLKAEVSWLVCKEECIPGKATLTRELPIVNDNPPRSMWAQDFSQTRKQLPLIEHDWESSFSVEGNKLVVEIKGDGPKARDIFPTASGYSANGTPPEKVQIPGGTQFKIPLKLEPPKNPGMVVTFEDDTSIEIEGPIGAGMGMLQVLLFALLGGMILNLMPCVFPVLSIKVLGFVQQAGEKRSHAINHSLVYSAGIIVSFWVLAGALLALRAGGAQLGWGFQLQSPLFLAGLAFLMVAVGMNLLGAFEVGGSFTGVGQGLAQKSGYTGSFFTGVLATIVATPCTAPFMGASIGFALAQPAWVSFMVFTFLGMGMALPYVLLSAFPAAGRLMPRPGAWMETFKQLMAFPIFATAVWLVSVMGQQTEMHYVLLLLEGLILFSLGLWALGKAPSWKSWVMAAGGVFILGGLALGMQDLVGYERTAKLEAEGGWQPYTEEALDARLQEGPVFIDFTAAWCITCQVNKRVVLNTAPIQKAFKEKGVALMRADWTNGEEYISRKLESFGRNGVPVYVLYSGPNQYELLPEILTNEIVLKALNKL